jgi:hypothetical protein
MANVTVGAFTATYLEASERVPYGYEGEPRFGLTARTWTIRAVLTVAEETALLNAYNGWRDARITDEDTATSRVVGTTIAFTLTGTVGQPVTALPCWFAQAPSSAPAGPWRLVTWTMVDAAQALAVLLKQQENNTGRDEPDLGTLTLGSAVLTLTSPMETYADSPEPQLLATGSHYLSGVPGFTRVRQVQGYCDASNWASLQTWFESTVNGSPAAGTYFPSVAPSASAEVIIDAGVKSTRYNVTLSLVQLR